MSDRIFSGGAFDWLSPFSVVTGVSLMLGYALLGAGSLIIKSRRRSTELGAQQGQILPSRRDARNRGREYLDAVARFVHCCALVHLAQW